MVQQKQNEQNPWQILEPGKVYFNYGPVSMVVMAYKGDEPLTELCCQSFSVIDSALSEISASLKLLKQYPDQISPDSLTGLPLRMYEAVKAIGEPSLTPMAAVAGGISDLVADWLFSQGASRAIVNNGGDIALRLAKGESVRIGLMSSLELAKIDHVVTIRAEDGIRGVATSGLGGRGFTRGIAQGVSVFSHSGIIADALATHMANSSYIDSENVIVATAGTINPTSDIKDLSIVVGVDVLTDEEVKLSLNKISKEAKRQKEKGNLLALCARVQNIGLKMDIPNK